MRSNLTAALLALLTAMSAGAAEPPAAIVLGVYAPRLAQDSTLDRTAYARALAELLTRASGVPIRGRAFTRADDLMTFATAGRLQLALVDPIVLVTHPRRFELIARGFGPEGFAPPQVVMSTERRRGIIGFEGRRLGLLDTGPRESALISNVAFEGEISVDSWFARIRRAADMGEILRWLDAGRIDCTVGYAHYARARGLHVVATLQGMPLPLLVGIPGAIPPALETAIRRAGEQGLTIPPLGPLTRLRAADDDGLAMLREAVRMAPGRRAVRRAVWSPLPREILPLDAFMPTPRRRYPLPALADRWRTPELSDEVAP